MITEMNHVGVSVSSLDRSVAFYRDIMGMELTLQKTFGGELYEAILGLKGASGRMAVLKAGSLRVELFEFAFPAPRPADPQRPVCDHGISHFCAEVTDIEATYERMKAAGVRFHCPPVSAFGVKATYGRDPDGNVFELLERPRSD